VAGFFAGGGMGQALVRAKETTPADRDIVFTLQLIIGCLIYTLFFIAAPWFAQWYDNPLYGDLLRVSALSFLIRPFLSMPQSILHRAMRFRTQTLIRILTLVIATSVSISMAAAGYGVWSLVLGGLAGSVCTAFVLAPVAKWRPGLSLDFRRGRGIAKYGFMVSINDIFNYLQNQVQFFILSRSLGPASVGLYNKGKNLSILPHSFITTSVYQVVFRAMAAEQDNLDKCRYIFFRSITLVAVYGTPFYLGFLWLAEPLVRGLYGNNWVAAAAPLAILAYAWPFLIVINLSGAVTAAKNWMGRELLVSVATFIITGLAVLIALPYGLEGIATAIVCVAVYRFLHMYYLALSCLKARWHALFKALLPATLLNLILALVLFATNHVLPVEVKQIDLAYVAAMAVSGGLVYAACFLYLPIPALATEQRRWKTRLHLPAGNKS
jgi:O-antigen/teichoic acid export membrane protein